MKKLLQTSFSLCGVHGADSFLLSATDDVMRDDEDDAEAGWSSLSDGTELARWL